MYSPTQDVFSQFIGVLVEIMIRTRRYASVEDKRLVDYQNLSTKIKISTEKLELHKIDSWMSSKSFPQVFEIKIASTDQVIERWIFDCHNFSGPFETPHNKTFPLFFKNFFTMLHLLPAYEYCTKLPQNDILVATKPFSVLSDNSMQRKNFQLVYNREILQITVEYTTNFRVFEPNQLHNTQEINSETSSLCDSQDSSPQISELRDSYPPIPSSRGNSPPPLDQEYDFEEIDLPYADPHIVQHNKENEFLTDLFSVPCPFRNSQVNIEQKVVQEKIVFPPSNVKKFTPFRKPNILSNSPLLRQATPHLLHQLNIDESLIGNNINNNDLPNEFPFSRRKEDPNDAVSLLQLLEKMKSSELSLFTENN